MPADVVPGTCAMGLGFAEARIAVRALAATHGLRPEPVPLRNAAGRILAADVLADHALPPFTNSAMDGFAVCAGDLATDGETILRVAGTMLAGGAPAAAPRRGECVRITTGAPLPPGTDAVVIKEQARVVGDCVGLPAGVRAGANVREAGEDCAAGARVLARGRRLRPGDMGLLAALGRTAIEVARQPRIGLCSSGDELVPPGQPLGVGQIHASNTQALAALVGHDGIEPARIAHLPDDPAAMRAVLRAMVTDCDVIITCGGVSAGEADFMPAVLAELGRIAFWKVRLKPGMPFLAGEIGATLVFGLPGNPVSTIATFLALVRPALLAMQGGDDDAPVHRARLATALRKRHERTELLRARIESRADGALWATPVERQGSGMLGGLAEADALLVVPEDARELPIGSVLEILPLPGLC
jgi:molybdopterin molybdotransferase